MKIQLTQEILDSCRKFAEERINKSENLYRYRGEAKRDKMIEDIVVGTMCEWGVYEYLKQKGYKTSEPDMQIYKTKRKSFAADLVGENLKVHVKGQASSSILKYGNSWLLQKTDKLVTSPSDNEYLALAAVDGLVVNILGIVRAGDVRYGQCRVPSYRHSKVAIYLDDLTTAGLDLEIL